jgi:hypothetical protein
MAVVCVCEVRGQSGERRTEKWMDGVKESRGY